MTKLKSHYFAIFIILFVSFYYGYNQYLFYEPQSSHKWRQADCLSITLNYHQYDIPFHEPQVHNLTSGGGGKR